MAAIPKYRGDDIPLIIGLTDADGNAINIDDLDELYVYVIHDRRGTTLKRYSKAGAGTFDALRRITAYSYSADWKSGSTKDAMTGEYRIEVNIVESDADFESSEKNTIASDPVINLIDANIKTLSSG